MASRPNDFSTLFEFLPIGAYRSRPDGVMVRANLALVRLNGFDSEAEQLAAVTDIAGRWYVQAGRRALLQQQMEREGSIIGFESEVWRYKTRERIWISENAHTVCDGDGRVLFYEGTVEEITERVLARNALERSEQELRAITAQVPGVLYRVLFLPDGTRQLTFISEGVHQLLGVGPELALQDNRLLLHFHHPDDAQRVAEAVAQAFEGETPLSVDFRVLLPGGGQKWVQRNSVASAPVGDTRVRIGMLLDISERKRAEDELRLNSERWKLALEATGDGVWDWLVQEGVETLSPQCKAMYGFAPDELPDLPDALDSRTHPDDRPGMRAAREAHFAGRTPSYVNEHRVQCKDGSWKWVLARGVVLHRDALGQPLRMIGTHTDITERKQAEALRLERDLAAAADHAKTLFLSRVSHELRTPLNAILGFAQLLEMQATAPKPAAQVSPAPAFMSERELGWVRQILTSGRHLLGLMDDILDLSSAQTGKLSMNPVALDLRPVVEEAWAMLAISAQVAGIEFIEAVPVDSRLAVRADRKRLKQIVSNLLSNAIKYNRPGGWVRVQARAAPGATGDSEGAGECIQVELSVADSGPGLSAAQRQRLFQPFERLGAQRGTVAGTGLGLALSRQLAEAMGGELEADSDPAGGARFVLRLPRA
jgi:PAS domain S-box-containing protein